MLGSGCWLWILLSDSDIGDGDGVLSCRRCFRLSRRVKQMVADGCFFVYSLLNSAQELHGSVLWYPIKTAPVLPGIPAPNFIGYSAGRLFQTSQRGCHGFSVHFSLFLMRSHTELSMLSSCLRRGHTICLGTISRTGHNRNRIIEGKGRRTIGLVLAGLNQDPVMYSWSIW